MSKTFLFIAQGALQNPAVILNVAEGSPFKSFSRILEILRQAQNDKFYGFAKSPLNEYSNIKSDLLEKTVLHYNNTAENYDKRWADYLVHTHRHFLRKIRLQPQNNLLDLSCGTGLLAKCLVERGDHFHTMILNDVAKHMQKIAKSRLAGDDNIKFTSFSADQLKLANHSIDKIFSLNAFHNYHRQSQSIRECYRVLKPGGKMFILDWNNAGLFKFKNWIIRQSGPELINTRSANEMQHLLKKHHFSTSLARKWYYYNWHLYYIMATKPK